MYDVDCAANCLNAGLAAIQRDDLVHAVAIPDALVIREEAHERVRHRSRSFVIFGEIEAANPKARQVGRTRRERRVAISSAALRALAKSSSHAISRTRAPAERAISGVLSCEPVSTMQISSTTPRTLSSASARKRSSSRTIMHRLIPAGFAGQPGGGAGSDERSSRKARPRPSFAFSFTRS